MRYMLIMRSTPEAEEASKDIPFEQIIEAMGRYNEELMKAGVMVSGEGLAPPEDGGFVVDFDSNPPTVTDGAPASDRGGFSTDTTSDGVAFPYSSIASTAHSKLPAGSASSGRMAELPPSDDCGPTYAPPW